MKDTEIKEQVKEFRLSRIRDVLDHKVFANLDTTFSYFIHVIPANFNELLIDLSKVKETHICEKMNPIGSFGCSDRYNFDGYLTFFGDPSNIFCYDQIIRNGIYEAYTSSIVKKNGESYFVYGENLIKETVNKVKNALDILKGIGVETPLYICLSIYNVAGTILSSEQLSGYRRVFINQEMVFSPVILQNYDEGVCNILTPIFDILWQSTGASSSPRINQ